MPKKNNKAIVPLFSNPSKGIIAQTKSFRLGLNPDEQAQDLYRQDHVLSLEEEIKSLSHAKEQIAYLKAFRDLLSGYCLQIDAPTTIIRCSEMWKAGKCRFEECKTRKPWTLFF